MDNDAMIAGIKKQEAELQFDAFNEHTAYAIGTALHERAVAESLPITVDIRMWDRQLFFCAMPGTTTANADWMRRKAWVVRNRAKSSYRAFFENKGEREIRADNGVGHADYALHGGAFPIAVKGTGIIGSIVVSGLHEYDDHRVLVDALCDHLGVDRKAYALPPK